MENSNGRLHRAWEEGQAAVRQKPYHSPYNPYDYDTHPRLAEAWENGAISAGWNEIYNNGILIESER